MGYRLTVTLGQLFAYFNGMHQKIQIIILIILVVYINFKTSIIWDDCRLSSQQGVKYVSVLLRQTFDDHFTEQSITKKMQLWNHRFYLVLVGFFQSVLCVQTPFLLWEEMQY